MLEMWYARGIDGKRGEVYVKEEAIERMNEGEVNSRGLCIMRNQIDGVM